MDELLSGSGAFWLSMAGIVGIIIFVFMFGMSICENRASERKIAPLNKLYALSVTVAALFAWTIQRDYSTLTIALAGWACGWIFGLTYAAHYIESQGRASQRLPSDQRGGENA